MIIVPGQPTDSSQDAQGYHFDPLAGLDFRYQPALGLGDDITRRDPSPVIEVDGTYHVWYTRNENVGHGFTGSIYHATSPDSYEWTEREEAILPGRSGAFDESGAFTPSVCIANGQYYLYYTAMPDGFAEYPHTTKGSIGVAVAESPDGPWKKHEDNPILACSDDPDAFDSLRVDDTCIVAREDGYWMYYKGKTWDAEPGSTKMGLARAEDPLGPWEKHADNPVIPSGHEVCVWPHGDGIGSLVYRCGPQANTLQYSANGVDFWQAAPARPPKAAGPYRPDEFEPGVGPGIEWGLSIGGWGSGAPYLLRFECDLTPPAASEH
jgi:beta-xylosidase